MRGGLALAALSTLLACGGGSTEAPDDGPPPWTAEQLHATWVWRIAYDDTLDEALVDDLGRRWLGAAGGDLGWRPPGAVDRSRWYAEDAAAVAAIGSTYAVAMCALGSADGTFGTEVPEGWAIAEEACLTIGEPERAALAAANLSEPMELPPGTGLMPVTDRAVELHGQTLHYRFLRPEQFRRAARGLAGLVHTEPETLVVTAGRSTWGGGLPDVTSFAASAPATADRAAYLEREAEAHIDRWRRSLTAMGLDPTDRSHLLGWVRRAVYRDLGLSELTARPDVAIGFLEEALGAAARPLPSPGADPWLLAALAQARLGEGEPSLAAEILRGIEGAEGWQFAGPVADACARVAVLPSTTSQGVKR